MRIRIRFSLSSHSVSLGTATARRINRTRPILSGCAKAACVLAFQAAKVVIVQFVRDVQTMGAQWESRKRGEKGAMSAPRAAVSNREFSFYD
jgi:hypothetical protein